MRTAILLAASAVLAWAGPRIQLIKEFPGSMPPYAAITIERDGSAQYQDSPTDDNPLKFKLTQAEVDEIYALAEKLGKFSRKLESDLKVARMGVKTFRWEESPTAVTEVKFNYSLDADARALADWLERIIETELNFLRLERVARFDRLGVNDAVLALQVSLERKRLVATDQFLPLLDRIVKNEAIMHMARARAASIAEHIRSGGKPAADAPEGPRESKQE
jgi:hypothetical protein